VLPIKSGGFFIAFYFAEKPAFIFGRPITFAGYFLILFFT